MFQSNPERTSIDKVLGRADVERVQALMQKEKLSRQDILVLMAYISGIEAKLLNLSAQERAVLLKFFTWIGEFVKLGELNYDMQQKINEQYTTGKYGKVFADILEKNESKIEHIFKCLANLYLNIARTSMSQAGGAFRQILEHKYDVQYTVNSGQLPPGVKP